MAGQCGRICRSWGGSIRMGIMVDIQDFESCETSGQFYGGNAGRKIGLVWRDGDWLVKFPGTTRNLQGSVPSYTTAPVSEWLGSHVYAALGIPVHETVLGIRDGRIVCACRDFTFPDSRLVNFHDLKNSLSDDEPEFTEDALDVRSCYVTDRGKPIAPLKYLASGQDEECTKALDRFMERYDPRSFHDLLDSIPSMSHGLTVVPDGFHEYHRRVCDYRYEHAFMEAWRELHPTVGFPSSPEASVPEPLPDPDPSVLPSSSVPTCFDGPGM